MIHVTWTVDKSLDDAEHEQQQACAAKQPAMNC